MTNILSRFSNYKYSKKILNVLYSAFLLLQFANLLIYVIVPFISTLFFLKNPNYDILTYIVYGFGFNTLFFFPYLLAIQAVKTIFRRTKGSLILFGLGIGIYGLIMSGFGVFIVSIEKLQIYVSYLLLLGCIVYYFYYFVYSIIDFRSFLKQYKSIK